jgi:hypothetical protein
MPLPQYYCKYPGYCEKIYEPRQDSTLDINKCLANCPTEYKCNTETKTCDKINYFDNDSYKKDPSCGGDCTKYNCNIDGTCTYQPFTGNCANEQECLTRCRWKCDGQNCVGAIDGEFSTKEKCEADCPNKYICENESCVRKYDKSIDSKRQGIYTEPTCGGRCNNYACTKENDTSLEACVLNDISSNSFLNESCDDKCINKYFCNTDGTCQARFDGKYSNKTSCETACKRWGCVEGKCQLTENGEYDTEELCTADCPNTYHCESNQCKRSKPDNKGKYTTSNCNEKCNRYSCTTDGKCIITEDGKYSSPNCEEKCERYSCVNNACVLTEGGDYSTPSCDGNCPRYDCDENGGCIDAQITGAYTDKSMCDDKCGYRYSCEDNQCKVVKSSKGIYKDSKCNEVCPRYKCASDGTCQPDASGIYKTINCDDKCVVAKRYKCNNNGICEESTDVNAPYTTDDCNGECSNLRYSCVNQECVLTAYGDYTNDTCGDGCITRYDCVNGNCVLKKDGKYDSSEQCKEKCKKFNYKILLFVAFIILLGGGIFWYYMLRKSSNNRYLNN